MSFLRGLRGRPSAYLVRGVSLVELLVVSAIVAILSSVAILSIQGVREASRGIACRNNMRGLSIAAKSFESAKGYLPAGALGYSHAVDWEDFRLKPNGTSWRKVSSSSFLVQILPFLEQGALSSQLHPAFFTRGESMANIRNRDGKSVQWFGEADGFSRAAESAFPQLFCPSDVLAGFQAKRVFGGVQPVTVGGDEDKFDFIQDLQEELPLRYVSVNYLACSGAPSGGIHPDPVRHSFRGAASSGERISSATVLDGASNTILFCETLGFRSDYRIDQVSSWVVGSVGRMRAMTPWMTDLGGIVDPTVHMLGTARDSAGIGFGSAHPSSVFCSHVDGSVDALSRDSDWLVLYARAGIADSKLSLPAQGWTLEAKR